METFRLSIKLCKTYINGLEFLLISNWFSKMCLLPHFQWVFVHMYLINSLELVHQNIFSYMLIYVIYFLYFFILLCICAFCWHTLTYWLYFYYCITLRKIPQFHLISWCGNFVERHSFWSFRINCAFPQNFHTRK